MGTSGAAARVLHLRTHLGFTMKTPKNSTGPPCCQYPNTHPRASSFLRQTQQQQSSESRRMSSSARRAPAPITPIRWLASARQEQAQPGAAWGSSRPHPPALTHVAGARQRVTRAIVAAAGFGTVGSVVAERAGEVTAGERARSE